MISRSNMGKQLTGNRTKKMAKGGATASKSNAAKGGAAPAAKSGGSAAGKTINTSSMKAGGRDGGGMLSNITNAVRGAFTNPNKKFTTVTDPKTGMSYAKPSYGAFSLKGLTSTDPANVARNRAAAAKYAALEAARPSRSENRVAQQNPVTPAAPAAPAAPTTPVTPTMVYVPAPAGYRPGIDPEHRFYQPQPTVAMKRGGKVKPKGKK